MLSFTRPKSQDLEDLSKWLLCASDILYGERQMELTEERYRGLFLSSKNQQDEIIRKTIEDRNLSGLGMIYRDFREQMADLSFEEIEEFNLCYSKILSGK